MTRKQMLEKVVALATCAEIAEKEKDDLQVIEALRRRGVEAVHAVWNDPDLDWSSFHLVVIRSTWDYINCRQDFLAWAEKLPRVFNPAPILRWNTDKRYLHDLAQVGLPVISTRFLEPGDIFEPPSAPFVIKPAISCGAKNTARYEGGALAAQHHVRRLQNEGHTVLVQPYLRRIEEAGEVAVIFIGGEYSHSICRGALLKEGKPPGYGSSLPLNVRPHEATQDERALAERVLKHLPINPAELLYARVDLVRGADGEAVILEVELTEPSLFLDFSNGGADRLANAIAAVLEA